MAFKDLRSFLDGPLELPIGGKVYVVPKLSAAAGLELQAEMERPEDEQVQGLESYRLLLGDVYDQMVDDGLTAEEIVRCALTVRTDDILGRKAAEDFFSLGEVPKALTAAAKATGKATQRRTRTAAASSTTGRGTGTNTRRTGKTTR